MTADRADLDIDVEALDRLRRAGPGVAVLDVREPWEVALCAIAGSLTIPLGELPNRLDAIPREQTVAVLCHHGVRSRQATLWLRTLGYARAVNVAGGIDAWAAAIDLSMRRY